MCVRRLAKSLLNGKTSLLRCFNCWDKTALFQTQLWHSTEKSATRKEYTRDSERGVFPSISNFRSYPPLYTLSSPKILQGFGRRKILKFWRSYWTCINICVLRAQEQNSITVLQSKTEIHWSCVLAAHFAAELSRWARNSAVLSINKMSVLGYDC